MSDKSDAMLLLLAIYLFIPFSNGGVTDYKTYKDHKVYEVKGNIDNIQKLITNLTAFAEISHFDKSRAEAEVMIAPNFEKIFSNAVQFYDLQKELIVDDFSKIIEHEKQVYRRSRLSFSWSAYYDVDDIYSYLKNMSSTYPQWASLVEGGQSYEGRQLLGLRINTPTKNNKKTVFIESGIHAREFIAPATTTYFINQLLTSSDPAITSLRDQFDWHIFPTVNPDGYHYCFTKDRMWRKSRSKSTDICYGVDLNRNWGYNWGKYASKHDPCDYEQYAGSTKFSEVETKTLSNYISGLNNLTAYIGFHSCGQMLLVPLSDSGEHISNYDDLVKIGKTSLAYGEKVNGAKYAGPDTAANILYPASGGSMDWVRYALNTPLVYTYELRGDEGCFSWPPEKIPEQGNEVTQMLLGLFAEACNLGYC